MDQSQQIAGLAALYAVIEVVKFFLNLRHDRGECILSSENQKKLDDLHDWHNIVDDDGRRLWYVPRHIGLDQKKIVEMLRDISHTQELTARLLSELIDKVERNARRDTRNN